MDHARGVPKRRVTSRSKRGGASQPYSTAQPYSIAIARTLHAIADEHAAHAWPATRWQADPAGFAHTILGVELWSAQVEILEAIRDHSRVAVAGGRKNGKDFALAVAALWWYGSFPDARVFMTATTARQVDGILYLEIRKRIARSGRCLPCAKANASTPCPHSAILTGRVGELARTGVTSDDFREIKGATANEAEGLAGTSGRILAIVDEASAYPDFLHVALRGNLAAEGCKEVLISNPTRNKGFFFDAFHTRAELYRTIQVSSLSGPNYVENREVFPGLASRAWVEEQKREWGEDSALYKVHVLGQFVLNEQGAIFSVGVIADAQARWHDEKGEGELTIGVDAATSESSRRDESAFAARRGKKIIAITTRRGLTPEGHLVEVLGMIATHGRGGRPRIVVDREGETGARVWTVFVGYLQAHPDAFDLSGVRSSERARRQPLVYDRIRDELVASFADWLRDGGAIPEDAKLAKELQAYRWIEHVSGRTKATPKDKLREELGRSPDRADAAQLSCWASAVIGATATEPAHAARTDAYDAQPDVVFDPYAGVGDPYAAR